jgi:hypothetical protein
MDTRAKMTFLVDRYAEGLVAAIDEAKRVRTIAIANGLEHRVRNLDRLVGFLDNQLVAARSRRLPPRKGYGFALSRYMDEYEWGEEGRKLFDLILALQTIWSEQPRD